jgi:anti-sigma factor RsiW
MMHDIVIEELETHLSGGGLYQTASREFYAHLADCEPCRAEVSEMDELSVLLRELKSDPAAAAGVVPEPTLGFYARVRNEIVEKQQKEAWGLFSPGAAFFRRIAFASLLLLAGLGSFLVTRESSFSGTDAASIMAQHDPVSAHSASSDRDRMLVTLATYSK